MSLFSAPGSVLFKRTLLKSLQRRCSQHPDLFSYLNKYGQYSLRRSNFPSRYTSGKAYGNLVLQATLPVAMKPPCVDSAFLGKCASITAVDLIHRKKLGSCKFFESNIAEARFENYLISYHSMNNDGISQTYLVKA